MAEEVDFTGAVNLAGGHLITGDNRISYAAVSAGISSFLDFTVTQFSQSNNLVLSSVKSINMFLDSNGGDTGQAFRIYNNTNPDGSPTENTYIFKVDESGDLYVTGDTSITGATTIAGALTATSLTTNTIASNGSNAELSIQPSGTGDVLISALRINGTTLDSSDSTKITIAEAVDITGNTSLGGTLGVTGLTTLSGSFRKAVHTFTGDDAITQAEHAGRLLLLGEVGGNANVTLTLPDATGTGDVYEFVVTVHMASNSYKIQAPDADNTITGQVQYLDEDGTAVTSYPTVAASDTITLNGGTQGGLVGDTLTLIDIAADKWMVKGLMRVSAGANPSTPFTAAVS